MLRLNRLMPALIGFVIFAFIFGCTPGSQKTDAAAAMDTTQQDSVLYLGYNPHANDQILPVGKVSADDKRVRFCFKIKFTGAANKDSSTVDLFLRDSMLVVKRIAHFVAYPGVSERFSMRLKDKRTLDVILRYTTYHQGKATEGTWCTNQTLCSTADLTPVCGQNNDNDTTPATANSTVTNHSTTTVSVDEI